MSALSVRRPLSVFAVLAMVATFLFAVGAAAGAADPIEPASPATFSACPDNADIPDAGFSDIPVGSFFDDAVNCLAYYTVTTGTTPTTYGPGEDVTRAQMAVFLYRMAGVAGVVLDATPPDAGFTDISELSPEAQTAINALAAKDIVKGKTTTTYAPADSVWRQQMALFLARFSDAASAPKTGPGGTQADDADPDDEDNDFTDLGSVTVEADTAINEVFHLEVAKGTTATTYDPLGNVNRGQMALFLTRLAAHMNVRPAGVNVQANPMTGNDLAPEDIDGLTSEVVMTVRTAEFQPVSNKLVDQFSFETTDNDDAFNSDGSCSSDVEWQPPGFPNDVCEIDSGDQATDGFGNGTIWELLTDSGDENEVYAWTGNVGADFDVDTTEFSMVTVDPTAVADGFTFELDGDDADAEYEFGDTATFVIQVQDGTKDVAQADWEFTIGTETEDTNGDMSSTGGVKYKTDADGQIEFTKTFTDPDKDDDGDFASFRVILEDWDAPLLNNSDEADLTAEWNDGDAVATTIKLSTSADYEENKDGTSNTVIATVTDQFGNGISGIGVCFSAEATQADGVTAAVAEGVGSDYTVRSTNSSGEARLSYDWDWGTGATELTSSAMEKIWGFFEVAPNVLDPTADDGDNLISVPADCEDYDAVLPADSGDDADDADYYWVVVAPDLDGVFTAYTEVLIADMDNNAAVGAVADAFHWFEWDSNDQFNKDNNDDVDGPVTQSTFENYIDDVNNSPADDRYFFVDPYEDGTSGISTWYVSNAP